MNKKPHIQKNLRTGNLEYSEDGDNFIEIKDMEILIKRKNLKALFKIMQEDVANSHHLADEYLDEIYKLIK